MRWIVFHILIAGLLMLDLGIFHRKRHEVRLKEAVLWTLFWIAVALGFNGWIFFHDSPEKAVEFFTGYVVEKSLSMDNLFVFLLIFSSFKAPPKVQHQILYVGIIGAIVLRLSVILAGAALIDRFYWMTYLFGLFLGFTGLRLIFKKKRNPSPEKSVIVRWVRVWFPKISPFLLVLIVVEATDIIFALDSIPAVFAITTDPFIVYTSNVFAILGLRSLYFVLAKFYGTFCYLKFGLGAVLIFVGTKMVIAPIYLIPTLWALGAIVAILAVSILCSISKPQSR
jgi:tellurite resistance protein TerC